MRLITPGNNDFGVTLFEEASLVGSLSTAELPWISPRINMPHWDAAKALLAGAYLSSINQTCTLGDDLLFCAINTSDQSGPWNAPWGRKPSVEVSLRKAIDLGLIVHNEAETWSDLVNLRNDFDHYKPDKISAHIQRFEERLSNSTSRPAYFKFAMEQIFASNDSSGINRQIQGMLHHGEFLRSMAIQFFLVVSGLMKNVINRTNWNEDPNWMAQQVEYQLTFRFPWSHERLRESAKHYLEQFEGPNPFQVI